MSSRDSITIECAYCGAHVDATIFRTLWIEDQKNWDLVFGNRLNLIECSQCGKSTHAGVSVLCTNVPGSYAVWWEPVPDPVMEEAVAGYAAAFGPESFYATAPRLSDWDEFKATIEKFESGDLVGQPAKLDMAAMMQRLMPPSPKPEGLSAKVRRFFGRS